MERKFLSITLLLIFGGCSKKDRPSSDSAEPKEDYCTEAGKHTPAVIAGTGESAFEPIEEGQIITPTFGPQGGHHVWVALQATGLNPGQGEMVSPDSGPIGGYVANIPKGEDPVQITMEISLKEKRAGPFRGAYDFFLDGSPENSEIAGLTALVDAWGIVAQYEGQSTVEANLWLSVVDACGTVVTDNKSFLLGLDDIDGIYD